MNNIPQSRIRYLRTWTTGPKKAELRSTSESQNTALLDLASNDYLGLSKHPEIIAAAKETIDLEGVGAGSSRFITGTRPIHTSLEKELASWLARERVFLFPSGFQANLAAVIALSNRHTSVIADRLSHYSLLMGIKSSGAKLYRYEHNDVHSLEKYLKQIIRRNPNDRPLVITESLFSMEGSSPKLKKMVEICDKYGARLLVDEAHALGVMGSKGRGLSYGIKEPLVMISGTFGKAFGSGGAFLATNNELGDKLLQMSGAFRYTTALAPPLAAAAMAALTLIQSNPEWASELRQEASYWRAQFIDEGWDIPYGEGPILPVIFGSDEEVLYRQNQLEKKGFLIVAIRPPTVPLGQARLRFVIRRDLPKNSLERVLETLKEK